MNYPVYSYRDKLTGFGAPMVDVSDQSAIRGFSFAVNSKDGLMNFNPGDFDLYKVGHFDTDTGRLVPLDVVELVVSGSSVVGV